LATKFYKNLPSLNLPDMTKNYFITLLFSLSAFFSVFGQCSPPTALTATNITATTATFNWTNQGTATSWDIEMLLEQSTPTGIPTHTGVTNPYVLAALST